MTLREKQRLRRIIESNARGYRYDRASVVRHVANGTASDPVVSDLRRSLNFHAHAIAEAVAALEDHADQKETP
jgi:hypothetical protein